MRDIDYGFWNSLPRPFVALAPLAGVTDAAFRAVIAKYGKPDVMWTEFVSAEGLASRGRDNIIHDLWKTEGEQPIVAQIYGSSPPAFETAAALIAELGFSGIDINMGCPSKAVEKHCAGAALIKDPGLAREVIAAAIAGGRGLPVSVKTRIGYRSNEIESWLPLLIDSGACAITIHARTRNEMSRVKAKWHVVERAVELARELRPAASMRPLIIGNGDVEDPQSAALRANEIGCDGVMIGRGIFGNPWLFSRTVRKSELALGDVVAVMLEHTELYGRLFAGRKSPDLLKKHFKAYLAGYGAAALRNALMRAMTIDEITALLRQALAEGDAGSLARGSAESFVPLDAPLPARATAPPTAVSHISAEPPLVASSPKRG